MKYIGHDTNSRNDIKVRKLIQRHGSKGYGVYWAVNEIIAEKVEHHNLSCKLEYSVEDLAAELNESPDTIQPILSSCIEFGLITFDGKNHINLKILKRLDEYTKKTIRRMSGQGTDSVPTVSPEKNEMKRNEIKKSLTPNGLDNPKTFFKAKAKERKAQEEATLDRLGMNTPIPYPFPTALQASQKAKDRKEHLQKQLKEMKNETH